MINAAILSILAGASCWLFSPVDVEEGEESQSCTLRAVSVPVEAHGLKTNVTLIVKCSMGEIRILEAYAGDSVLECTDEDSPFVYRYSNETDLCVQAEDIGDAGVLDDVACHRIDVRAHLSECFEESDRKATAWVVSCDALGKAVLGTPKVSIFPSDARMMKSCSWVSFSPQDEKVGEDSCPNAEQGLLSASNLQVMSDGSSYCRRADFDVSVSCELPEDVCVYRLKNVEKAKKAFLRKSCVLESPDKLPFTLCELMDNGMTFERAEEPTRHITLVGRATWVTRVCCDDAKITLRRRVADWIDWLNEFLDEMSDDGEDSRSSDADDDDEEDSWYSNVGGYR